ncbi:MAG: hypothetical protein ACHQ50_09400 [Fimbriimonadales bacterium]
MDLTEGHYYWLKASSGPQDNLVWNYNSLGYTGWGSAGYNSGEYWDPNGNGAFSVRVNPRTGETPEPFTMGLGLAGAGLFIRRRMKATRAQ